jgi:transposase
MEKEIRNHPKRKKRRIEILRREELTEAIKCEKDWQIKLKLSALNLMATLDTRPKEVAGVLGLSFKAIYNWSKSWNRGGVEGLKEKGSKLEKPPRLGKKEIERLKEYLKEKVFWTTKEVRCLIKERFEVELSEDQIRRILRR